MAERFAPIVPVKTRGAFATHEGATRTYDDERAAYVADESAALALVVRGLGSARSGRPVANRVADMCVRIFRERTSSMLDDLAEVWWRAEHGAGDGGRVRPFSSLPIADRADLRARVKRLLLERVPDALGDQAVLEAETTRLLELPALALSRAGKQIERLAEEKQGLYRGEGASAACVIFAAGKASIAHVGDCGVLRLRRGRLEPLTRAHTLVNAYKDSPGVTAEQLAAVPEGVVVRVLGAAGEMSRVEVITADLEPRDLFLLHTRGTAERFSDDDFRRALLAHGASAAPHLIETGKAQAQDNIAAVAVEIR